MTADLARTKFWRERYATLGPGIKVGIAWRDTAAHVVARHQVPELRLWRPLLSLPGIQWIGLLDSPEDRRESASVAKEQGVVVRHFPEAELAPDLDELAARVAALDVALVVGGFPPIWQAPWTRRPMFLPSPATGNGCQRALQHRGIGRCGSSGPIEPGGGIRFCGSVRNCSSNTWLRPTNSRWAPSGVPIGRRPRWRISQNPAHWIGAAGFGMTAPITSSVGLVTGFPIASTVASLIAIEQEPVTQLTNQNTTLQNQSTAIQTLEAQLLALESSTNALGQTSLYQARTSPAATPPRAHGHGQRQLDDTRGAGQLRIHADASGTSPAMGKLVVDERHHALGGRLADIRLWWSRSAGERRSAQRRRRAFRRARFKSRIATASRPP